MMLVSLDDAKTHLHVTDPARDAEVTTTVEQASDAILKYLDDRADESWDETTTPDVIQRCTLELVALFWEHRGDGDTDAAVKTWNWIAVLLSQSRDPLLA